MRVPTVYLALIAGAVLVNTITNGVIAGGFASVPVVEAATPHGTHVNVVLETSCLTKPIVLIDCEVLPSGDVHNCRTARISYRPKCVTLEITHGR